MIRKQILKDDFARKVPGFDLESVASFEISSEDAKHPIENALGEDQQSWRAAEDGEQTIRITFDSPQTISRIGLCFEESNVARTQEFVLLWRSLQEPNWREIVRQQFNFSPPNTTIEREEFNVSLNNVISIELKIVPEIGGKGRASLRELFIG
jgi:XRCC1 N terminal domain